MYALYPVYTYTKNMAKLINENMRPPMSGSILRTFHITSMIKSPNDCLAWNIVYSVLVPINIGKKKNGYDTVPAIRSCFEIILFSHVIR